MCQLLLVRLNVGEWLCSHRSSCMCQLLLVRLNVGGCVVIGWRAGGVDRRQSAAGGDVRS